MAGIKKWEFPFTVSPRHDLGNGGIPMQKIVLQVRFSVKERLSKNLRRCRDADVRLRYLIILNGISGRSGRQIAAVLKVHNTTVYRVLQRFRQYGEAGLY